MDGVKSGVSYPPNLADSKEETPNEQTAYHAGQWTKEETRQRSAEPMSEYDSDAMEKEGGRNRQRGKAAFPIRQTWRMQKRKHRTGKRRNYQERKSRPADGETTKKEKAGYYPAK